jgi:D-alanyl-lipoteichoic acid acyltransferase DltB (MBOAT superfamily)
MLFNSYIFWAFFACVFILYRLLRHKGQNYMLLVASYIFYAYWDWRFLFLMLFSTVVDYFAAIGIGESQSQRRRKTILVLSICVQLGLLGIFKYYDFFARELSGSLGLLGFHVSLPILGLLLPVGISFYTFQTMSYTIDVYRGQFKHTRNFFDFALFVSFFPHLVAGPIVRAAKLLPQISNPRVRRPDDFREGLYYVTTGLFKKVVVADNLAVIANTIFNTNATQLSGLECLMGIYAFAFQIYCDFSGYSSIAQGVAKWLNIELTTNFNQPYLAVSPSDFWSRWHISLSTWFRDYLFVPLVSRGDQSSKWRWYYTVLVVMLLSGLWHGAGWTFLAWGLFHGLLLCIYRLLAGRRYMFFQTPQDRGSRASNPRGVEDRGPRAGSPREVEDRGSRAGNPREVVDSSVVIQESSIARLIKILVTFHLVCFGWLLFRAGSLTQVWSMLERIASDIRATPFAVSGLAMIAFYAGPLMVYEFWVERKADPLRLVRINWLARGVVYSYCALMLWFFPPPVSNVFIYFQF